MTLETIAVHLDHTPACARRVDLAARLAQAHGSHLVGVVPTGLPAGAMEPPPPSDENRCARGSHEDHLALQAQAVAHLFDRLMREHAAVSHEHRKVNGSPVDALVLAARTSDLIVLGQPDADSADSADRGSTAAAQAATLRDLCDQVVMRSGRPVLVVPVAARAASLGERVLVAWDSSREASLAARDALPLLRKAKTVSLVTLGHSEQLEERQAKAAEMVQWLARHGVQAEAEQYLAVGRIGAGLLNCAAGMDADLIVMGGYAQGPMREALLGGVTRDILSQARVPVLLSH